MFNPLRKGRNFIRACVQSLAPPQIKRFQWDREFASGRWNCLEHMAGDCLYPFLEKYARGGHILDLGCGPGATGNEINFECYRTYTGIDISQVALEKARRRTEQNRRSTKNEYVCSDLVRFAPADKYSVIVFGDSIYYLQRRRIGPILDSYSRALADGGVFVVRIRGAHPYVTRLIESRFRVIEKEIIPDPLIYLFVFQPLAAPIH